MVCPNCGREYRDGVDYCLSCDVALEHDEQEEQPGDTDDFIEVFSAYSVSEVEFIRSVLETEAIRFRFEMDVYSGDTEELIKPAVLYVSERDFDRVESLLREQNII